MLVKFKYAKKIFRTICVYFICVCVYFITYYVDPNVTDITAYRFMIFGYSSFTNFARELNRHIFDRMIEVLYNQKEIASKVRLNISSIHCSFVNCTCLSNLRCTVSKYYKLFFLPYQDLGKRKFYFYLFSLFF